VKALTLEDGLVVETAVKETLIILQQAYSLGAPEGDLIPINEKLNQGLDLLAYYKVLLDDGKTESASTVLTQALTVVSEAREQAILLKQATEDRSRILAIITWVAVPLAAIACTLTAFKGYDLYRTLERKQLLISVVKRKGKEQDENAE
jgi:hypothetical protein